MPTKNIVLLADGVKNETYSSRKLVGYIAQNYGYSISEETINSCIANINFEFYRENKRGKLLPC